MKSLTADNLIRIVFAGMAFALVLTWGNNVASAQEGGSALTIASSGQVIVKNASVLSVTGNVVRAQTVWGNAVITFDIQTTGSTRFVPSMDSIDALKAIKPGNSISFSGTLVGSLANPTVYATVVRDSTLVQESASVVGTVESVDAKGKSFVIESDGTKTTVYVPGSALMSRDGGNTSLRDIQIGDSAKAIGTLDTSEQSLSAQRVTIATMTQSVVPEPVGPQELEQTDSPGVISSLLNWLKGSRGMLSIR